MTEDRTFFSIANKRKKFIVEMMKNAMLPYEAEKTYYEMNKIGVFENELEERAFRNFFKIVTEPSLLLDLACGDGRHTAKLSEKAGFVVGLDLSPTNLTKVHRNLQDLDNVALIRACMFNPPFPHELFDGVWFSQAFEYVPPDMRKEFLRVLESVMKHHGPLYMSVETWQDPNPLISVKNMVDDFRLFAYWKFIKRKPLHWGEFLYYLPPMEGEFQDWHYHVHTSKRTIEILLKNLGMSIIEDSLYDGYVYLLCRRERSHSSN